MDPSRFDSLARTLARSGSRRRLLAGFAAAALELAGARGADAIACRAPGLTCRENTNCCSGSCARDVIGRRTCQCRTAADCPPARVCGVAACLGGACTDSVHADGTPCTPTGGGTGICQDGTCVAPTTTTGAPCLTAGTCCPDPATPCFGLCCTGALGQGASDCGGGIGYFCSAIGCGGPCATDNDCFFELQHFCNAGTCTCGSGTCFGTICL